MEKGYRGSSRHARYFIAPLLLDPHTKVDVLDSTGRQV